MTEYDGPERRAFHNACLKESQWGELHEYMKNQTETLARRANTWLRTISLSRRTDGIKVGVRIGKEYNQGAEGRFK